ncbi:MAG: hypothetical protein AAF657_04760 [Acidobacteriota bacterium]
MKKSKKNLCLKRETLKVEEIVSHVAGGWVSQQCNPTDYGPASVCQQCGTGICGCINPPDWCHISVVC